MALLLATLASGLFGTVVRAPAAPVCNVNAPCTAPAAHATLLFTRQGVVSPVTTDAHGAYRISLAPGTYAVRMKGSSRIGRLVPATVVVRRGVAVRRNFSYDSGIR